MLHGTHMHCKRASCHKCTIKPLFNPINQLLMQDSYGDGWNGNYYHWIDSSGVDTTGTLLIEDAIGEKELCIPATEQCATFYVDETGGWLSEVSWVMFDTFGATVATGTADNVQHQICAHTPAPSNSPAPTPVLVCYTVRSGCDGHQILPPYPTDGLPYPQPVEHGRLIRRRLE